MKNIINKFIVIVLIFAFIMPEFVMAKVKVNRSALLFPAKTEYKQRNVKNNTKATLPAIKPTINTDEKTNITVNNATTSNNKKEYKLSEERIAKLNSLIKNVNTAKEDVVTMCGGISNDLSKIKGLGITASITSGIGTGLAASALATGMKRTEQIEEKEEAERQKKLEEDRKKQEEERLRKLEEEKRKQEELAKKKEEEEKKKKQDENKDDKKEEEKKDDEGEAVEDKEKEDKVVEENGKDDDKKEEEKEKKRR